LIVLTLWRLDEVMKSMPLACAMEFSSGV